MQFSWAPIEIGEALCLLYAIQWVHELQLTNVDFEMDAKLVVDYFNTAETMLLNLEQYWRNAKDVAMFISKTLK